MDQVIEAREIRVVIDNRLRLLVLQYQKHMVRSREFIDEALLGLTEGNFWEHVPPFLRQHSSLKEHVNCQRGGVFSSPAKPFGTQEPSLTKSDCFRGHQGTSATRLAGWRVSGMTEDLGLLKHG
jgi:hypothetical protein